jgi:hypothetical protein
MTHLLCVYIASASLLQGSPPSQSGAATQTNAVRFVQTSFTWQLIDSHNAEAWEVPAIFTFKEVLAASADNVVGYGTRASGLQQEDNDASSAGALFFCILGSHGSIRLLHAFQLMPNGGPLGYYPDPKGLIVWSMDGIVGFRSKPPSSSRGRGEEWWLFDAKQALAKGVFLPMQALPPNVIASGANSIADVVPVKDSDLAVVTVAASDVDWTIRVLHRAKVTLRAVFIAVIALDGRLVWISDEAEYRDLRVYQEPGIFTLAADVVGVTQSSLKKKFCRDSHGKWKQGE